MSKGTGTCLGLTWAPWTPRPPAQRQLLRQEGNRQRPADPTLEAERAMLPHKGSLHSGDLSLDRNVNSCAQDECQAAETL